MQAGSGLRSSTRVLWPRAAGMRIRAERFEALQARVAGGLIARDEALIRVHERVRDGGHAAHVLEEAGDEAVALLREAALALGVEEDVLPVLEEAHVRVHTRAVYAEDGLGHEGRVQAVLLREGLDGHAEGHDVVRGGEGVGVLEVNLVLPGGDLVMARLYLEAHLLEGEADVAADEFAVIDGTEVKVARLVAGLDGRAAVGIRLEEEELALRADVEGVAHFRRPREGALQYAAGVADEGRAVGVVDVADEPRGAGRPGGPGQSVKLAGSG